MRGVVIDMNAMVVKKVVGKCLDKGKCKAEPARARPNMIASIIEENGLQASGFKDAKHYWYMYHLLFPMDFVNSKEFIVTPMVESLLIEIKCPTDTPVMEWQHLDVTIYAS